MPLNQLTHARHPRNGRRNHLQSTWHGLEAIECRTLMSAQMFATAAPTAEIAAVTTEDQNTGEHNDQASYWMRVAQKNTIGSVVLPRVGWEVQVGYIEGDPDRPIIVGHIYNTNANTNTNTNTPHELPGGQTTSSMQTATTDGGGIKRVQAGRHERHRN